MCRVIKKHWNFWLGTNCKNIFISSFKCLIKKVMSLLLTRLTRLKIMILTPSDKKLLGALEAVRSRPLHQHGRPAALFRVFTIKHLHRQPRTPQSSFQSVASDRNHGLQRLVPVRLLHKLPLPLQALQGKTGQARQIPDDPPPHPPLRC